MVEKVRSLGFKEAYAIGLGTMIAAGIFSLSGTAVAEIGSTAVLSFVIAAVVAGVTAAAYSEFASIYSESGGGYLFTSRTFDNDYLVYTEGLMLFFGYTATTAFYLSTAGEWIHRFIFPAVPPWVGGIVIATLLGILNARGTEESGAFQVIVSAAKVLVLLIFIAGVFVYKPPGQAVSTFVTSIYVPGDAGLGQWVADVAEIASLAFITFFGFSAIAASAGEIKNPTKTVPLSIAASIVTVTILYAMVIFAMVNSPIDAEIIAQEGETAMGRVAAAYLGDPGKWLIVAGAIFSMASASNASILAASRIGFLMGKEGRAFRKFQNINPKFGTPRWSIAACTVVINVLIITFMAVFHGENALFSLDLGLETLTAFATTNLLIPLSVVNIALIFSRRKFPDMDRPFRLPLVPLTPIIGIIANLYLVWRLPRLGFFTGILGVAVFIILYILWGGKDSVSEVIRSVTDVEVKENGDEEVGDEEDDVYTMLIPLRSSNNTKQRIQVAQKLSNAIGKEKSRLVFLHYENVPSQVPIDQAETEYIQKTVDESHEVIQNEELEDNISVDVQGHITRNMAFDIVNTARDEEANLIIMGYPDENTQLSSRVKNKTPCDIMFLRDVESSDLDRVTIGTGSGPHHRAMLPVVKGLGKLGSKLFIASVNPENYGNEEDPSRTVKGISEEETAFEVQNTESPTVAEGLVDKAEDNESMLIIGASRDNMLKKTVFGSTPDRTIQLARERDIPVMIYGGKEGLTGKLGSALFVIYDFFRSYF